MINFDVLGDERAVGGVAAGGFCAGVVGGGVCANAGAPNNTPITAIENTF